MIKVKCIILAAGYATRLYPLTINKPKPLLKVAGKPMINYLVEKIEDIDEIDEVFVVTNNKFYDNFMQWKIKNEFKKKITIVNDKTTSNDDRLGAVGDLQYVIENKNINEDLVIIAGDNLFRFSLLDLHKFSKEKNSSVIAVYDLEDPLLLAKKFGVVLTDEKNKIINFEEKPEKPKSSLCATVCYVIKKKDLNLLSEIFKSEERPDNIGEIIRFLVKESSVYAIAFKEKWIDIGSFSQLEEANKEWSKKQY